MQFMTGTVVEGKVVLSGVSLPEGATVAILAEDTDSGVQLPPHLVAELNDALDEADREEGISADELFARLGKLG